MCNILVNAYSRSMPPRIVEAEQMVYKFMPSQKIIPDRCVCQVHSQEQYTKSTLLVKSWRLRFRAGLAKYSKCWVPTSIEGLGVNGHAVAILRDMGSEIVSQML